MTPADANDVDGASSASQDDGPDPFDATLRLVAALEAASVDYMVVGSFSSNLYGVDRSTADADFLVSAKVADLTAAARSLGPEFVPDPQIGFESVTGLRRIRVGLKDSGFEFEFFLMGDDPHDAERFARRVRKDLGDGREAWAATAEDLIIAKLRWAKDTRRAKDREDLETVLFAQRGRLDLPYIERWAAEHGTLDLYREIAASIPPLD
ncbi:hypothetical protein [Alienimonas californiensis]|uniref:Uncharacterized protein n=1 Tax=Alienimonas californiensis TaxID=2527989 RepID=A0A517P5I5_9PLAN|nr:hypothetical protein [Alienimonas californiensis]QDT14639.1 hypothetical protein CA12_07150 [Alienimonas californiensis]